MNERPHVLQLLLGATQPRRDRSGSRPQPLPHAAHHGGGVTDDRAGRRHQAAVTADHRIACFRRARLAHDCQHPPGNAPAAIADATRRIAHGGAGALHRPCQHAHAILQQRAVRRIVHVGFYDRRIDTKAAIVRHPRPLRDVYDPLVQRGGRWAENQLDPLRTLRSSSVPLNASTK